MVKIISAKGINLVISKEAIDLLVGQHDAVSEGGSFVGIRHFSSISVNGKKSGERFMACGIDSIDADKGSVLELSGKKFYIDDYTLTLLTDSQIFIVEEDRFIDHNGRKVRTTERLLRAKK